MEHPVPKTTKHCQKWLEESGNEKQKKKGSIRKKLLE